MFRRNRDGYQSLQPEVIVLRREDIDLKLFYRLIMIPNACYHVHSGCFLSCMLAAHYLKNHPDEEIDRVHNYIGKRFSIHMRHNGKPSNIITGMDDAADSKDLLELESPGLVIIRDAYKNKYLGGIHTYYTLKEPDLEYFMKIGPIYGEEYSDVSWYKGICEELHKDLNRRHSEFVDRIRRGGYRLDDLTEIFKGSEALRRGHKITRSLSAFISREDVPEILRAAYTDSILPMDVFFIGESGKLCVHVWLLILLRYMVGEE